MQENTLAEDNLWEKRPFLKLFTSTDMKVTNQSDKQTVIDRRILNQANYAEQCICLGQTNDTKDEAGVLGVLILSAALVL